MNRAFWIASCLLLLVACSRHEPRNAATAAGAAPLQAIATRPEPAEAARRPNGTLAYEHNVTIELTKEMLAVRMQDVQTACTSNKSYSCTVLDMNLRRTQTVPSGNIRMRMLPAA